MVPGHSQSTWACDQESMTYRAGTHLWIGGMGGDRPILAVPAEIPEGAEGVHPRPKGLLGLGFRHLPCGVQSWPSHNQERLYVACKARCSTAGWSGS